MTERQLNGITREIIVDIRVIENRLNALDKDVVKLKTQLMMFIILLEISIPLLKFLFHELSTSLTVP